MPRKRILVVDDSGTARMLEQAALSRGPYDITIAKDGQEGVEKARAEKPDLILMDMHLPVLDGWEATRQLKESEETKHIPIIALTADAMAGDREKAMEAGCDDYDTKPIELPRLLDKINARLGRQRHVGELGRPHLVDRVGPGGAGAGRGGLPLALTELDGADAVEQRQALLALRVQLLQVGQEALKELLVGVLDPLLAVVDDDVEGVEHVVAERLLGLVDGLVGAVEVVEVEPLIRTGVRSRSAAVDADDRDRRLGPKAGKLAHRQGDTPAWNAGAD